MHDTRYIQFFDGGHEPEHALLGGKCASLLSLTAAGMPVPPGFAVTTATYDRFIADSGLAAAIVDELAGLDPEDVDAVDAVSARIREQICTREVPDELRAQFYLAYHDLQERCGAVDGAPALPVAVRSSATAEDLPDASFAGQQDTYLWITGVDDVADHIRRCWASLYTSRAITYRLKNAIPDEGLSMAVAVQKMVNARAAGVAMTLNPATGDRSKIAIDASWGVGEMVVSGQVTPDNLLLDKVMLSVVTEHVGDKHAELVPDPVTGDLVEREVEPERRAVRCLSDDEVRAIATIAKRAEKHYGCPQDIEWALDADLPAGSDLLLLQSRPETVHSAPAAAAPAPAAAPASSGFSFGSFAGLAASAGSAAATLPHHHTHQH